MIVTKEYFEGKKVINITDKKDQFHISIYGSDLYWIMTDYHDGNEFFINNTDTKFYNALKDLFREIEKRDYKYLPLYTKNTLKWLSEARQPEESSTLEIVKGDYFFIIRFIRGEKDHLAKARNICPICFALSGSRNPGIAAAFGIMYNLY